MWGWANYAPGGQAARGHIPFWKREEQQQTAWGKTAFSGDKQREIPEISWKFLEAAGFYPKAENRRFRSEAVPFAKRRDQNGRAFV